MTFKHTLAFLMALSVTSATAEELPQAGNAWFKAAQDTLAETLKQQPNTGTAKNVIILISDGNGVGSNYATRLYSGQLEGGYGDDYVQPFETFPNLALVKTYNVNAQTPDSAGTGTAIMTGIKTNSGVLGVNENVRRGDCTTIVGNEVATLNEVMTDMGKATGVVSTARLTHATPASGYAHTVDRRFEYKLPEGCTQQADIATQLIDAMEAGTIDIALGGGRRNFIGKDITDEEGRKGKRAKGENLIARAERLGVQYVWDDKGMALAKTDGTPVLGLFERSHMMYETERTGEPSLAEMTAFAIKALSAKGGDQGFFLQVEAGRVDHASHASNAARMVADGKAFADAVAMADALTDDGDTLIVVTADHEHAVAFNGYCGRGTNILGLCMEIDDAGVEHTGEPALAKDGKPYTVIGYLNGPGSILRKDRNWTGGRPDLTQEEALDIDNVQQALIPRSSETHSGEDVAVYAKGPWAHLLEGTLEQNVIFHVMYHAATQ
ncbi:alkaline phosphatase [Shimia thalassica]|uniref:alkaline phosphatase n=1 Tax=Shimia thalassica TaxID=1715693 RepID=UPI0026E1F503|nr:alkaline phosphatase [Shimia thalassica]MDO6797090.1 alkaline phosphatase [Shimia thalassica]